MFERVYVVFFVLRRSREARVFCVWSFVFRGFVEVVFFSTGSLGSVVAYIVEVLFVVLVFF